MDEAASESSPPALSSLTIAWCLVAGGFLLLAPADGSLWGRVMGAHDAIGRIAALRAVRMAVSAFGLLLFLIGMRDLVSVLLRRASR